MKVKKIQNKIIANVKDKINIFNKPKTESKLKEKENPSDPITINSNSINQRIELLKQQNENKSDKKEKIQCEIKTNIKNKINIFNEPKNEPMIEEKENKPKTILKSDSINQRIELFKNQNENKRVEKENNQIEIKANLQDKINIFNKPKNEPTTKEKENPSLPKNKNSNSFNQRVELFKQQNENKNEAKENIQFEIKTNLKNKINIFNKPKIEPIINVKEEEQKIIKGSKLISNDNPDMKIYQFPNKKFESKLINNSKVLLFIGEHQELFINSFINICRDINYEDKERYKIDINDLNNQFNIYYIKARSGKYNIIIISIRSSLEKGEFMNNILTVFDSKAMTLKKIHFIFITLENKNQLRDKTIITFSMIMHLFQKETIGNYVKILFLKDNSNDLVNENKNITFRNYLDISFDSIYNPEYLCVNGKILYDNNSENNKVQWNILSENIKNIQNQLRFSKSVLLDEKKVSLFKNIFSDLHSVYRELLRLFENMIKREKVIFINFLLFCEITTNEMYSLILFLYNNIIENKKEFTIKNKEITLVNDINLINTLYVLSKVKFKNLIDLCCNKCSLQDISLNYIKNLFSNNLRTLDLSNNDLVEMEIFNKEESLYNLYKLDLSYNKITNINYLINCNLTNLIELNLSHNLISDITCLQNELKFKVLEELDLSFNKIKKLNKINIRTLNCLVLINNEISEGILDFLNQFYFNIDELILTKSNNILSFEYHKDYIKIIDLKYALEEKNVNEILKSISFKNIKYLDIVGFNNIEFLSNISLQDLVQLNFKMKINDLSIFNNIKFKEIKKISFCEDSSVSKGFNSLNIFSTIKVQSINIVEKDINYKCCLSCNYPEFKFTFFSKDLNFLKEQFFENPNQIYIEQKILDNKNNWDFFSYNDIIKSFPIFKNLKAEVLDIVYNNNKFIFSIKFYGHNFRMHFPFEEMKFIYDNIFKSIERLSLSNMTFDDNISIEKEYFDNLKELNLNNNIIETMKIFSEVANRLYVINESKANLCKSQLIELFEKGKFRMNRINSKGNQIQLYYVYPFYFYLNIDKIQKIKFFEGCKEIHLINLQLDDEDIKFLENETLSNLRILNLDGNQITNLNIFNYIQSLRQLETLSLKDNLFNSGIEIINNNESYELQSIKVKLNKEDQRTHIISFKYFIKNDNEKSGFYIDFDYLYDIDKSLDIFKELNFRKVFDLNLSGIKLKNINFMENKAFKHISKINYDDNYIDDISILERIGYYINNVSLKKNPIRKGLHVLKKYGIDIELDIEKKENEYKVLSCFKDACFDVEFYINNINDIKNILDYNNSYIKLMRNDSDELKSLESEIINKSNEQKNFFELVFKMIEFFKNNMVINIMKVEDNSEIITDNNIFLNDNNYEILEKLFSYFQSRLSYLPYISKLYLEGLENEDEKLIKYLSFLHIGYLHFSLNLDILKTFHIIHLNLANTNVTDIKGLCDIKELEILDLSNNEHIANLFLLKYAKFLNLKNLYLSNDNLENLYDIGMNEYKFSKLKVLDLSNNRIQDLTPVLIAFKYLNYLNVEKNLISEKYIIYELNKLTSCKINYANNYIYGLNKI